jgi:hypothetical protein
VLAVGPFRYALRLEDGGDAGRLSTFTTASDDWDAGDTFYDADRIEWRIVRVLEVEPPRSTDVDGVFIVEAVKRGVR